MSSTGTHHTCRLGQWYDNVTDERITGLPAFKELLEAHRLVHAKGRDALSALGDGRGDEARQRLDEVTELSRQVIAGLDALKRANAA